MFSPKNIVIFFTCVISFILITQNSYSTEQNDEVVETEIDSTQVQQDSLFAQINRNFQTVKPILEFSCYDCHSENTKEPWYFNIPGVNSFVASHVKDGKKHLNFTDGFPFKTKESQMGILHEIKEEVAEGEMPLFSYRLMHWGRLIEGAQQDSLFQWIDTTLVLLNNFQSLQSDNN